MTIKFPKVLIWMSAGLFIALLLNLLHMPPPVVEEQVIFSEFMVKLDKGDFEPIQRTIRISSRRCGRKMFRSRSNHLKKALGI